VVNPCIVTLEKWIGIDGDQMGLERKVCRERALDVMESTVDLPQSAPKFVLEIAQPALELALEISQPSLKLAL
jgi:hypothetical protein